MTRYVTIGLLLLLTGLLQGQSLPLPAPQPVSTQLSDMEKLWVELHKTQIALEQALADGATCRASLRGFQLTDDQARLKSQIEKGHPGFVLDMGTGKLVPVKPSQQ